ncbi:MAG: hypothetical protein C0631_09425 [Sedimenticola sp.]|nr:MAG: hypothetical protein C0631_09425 [Sedimenticola sp.]
MLSVAAAALLQGCVSGSGNVQSVSAEELVKQRAEERWALVIDGRLESAYEYLTPAYRKAIPYNHYRKKIKGVGVWEKATVDTLVCEEEICNVTLKIWTVTHHALLKKPIRAESFLKEIWVKRADYDTWYLQPDI